LMVAPILEELAKEYDGRVNFVKLDVDQNPKTAAKYKVMSIPTLLIFRKGQPASHLVGFRPKNELKRTLDAALAGK
jgi:thioredoxin 1